jgi:tRNA 2-selenouridine synthase SelU
MFNYPPFQLSSEKSQLDDSNKHLKSKIEQLEKELNENKININSLKKQAQEVLEEKGRNVQQLQR